MSEDEKEKEKKNENPWWKRAAYTGFLLAVFGWGFDYIEDEIKDYKASEDKKWSEIKKTLNEIRVQQDVIKLQQDAIWQATSDTSSKLEGVKADQDFQKYVTAYQQRLIENAHSNKNSHQCEMEHKEKKSEEVRNHKDVKNLSTLQKMMKKLGGSDEEKKLIKEVEDKEHIESKIKELSNKPKEKVDEDKNAEQMKREYIQQHEQKIQNRAVKELKELDRK